MVQAARGRPRGANICGHVSRLQVPGPRAPPRQLWRAALQGEVSDSKYQRYLLHTERKIFNICMIFNHLKRFMFPKVSD